MSYTHTPPVVGALGAIGTLCAYYFGGWLAFCRKNPIKHTAIALLLSNAALLIGVLVIQVSQREFRLSTEYVWEIIHPLTGGLVGQTLTKAFVICCFIFGIMSALIKVGPRVSWVDATDFEMGDAAMGHGSYKKLSARACAEIKIELLEEMLQAQREKLKGLQ